MKKELPKNSVGTDPLLYANSINIWTYLHKEMSCIRVTPEDLPDNLPKTPDWEDEETGGSIIRAAIWLFEKIGEGNLFTKQELRDAFPGVEQIDRRMRELRPYGWIIADSRQDDDLKANQLKLVKIGAKIWIPEERAAASISTISTRIRAEVFARDNHQCARCGISAGEAFDEFPNIKARLTAAHIYPGMLSAGKVSVDEIVTACQFCNETLKQHTPNYLNEQQIWERIKDLGVADKQKIMKWMALGRRPQTQLDRLWSQFRQLPGVDRESIKDRLSDLLG